jgi:hypothetical protein
MYRISVRDLRWYQPSNTKMPDGELLLCTYGETHACDGRQTEVMAFWRVAWWWRLHCSTQFQSCWQVQSTSRPGAINFLPRPHIHIAHYHNKLGAGDALGTIMFPPGTSGSRRFPSEAGFAVPDT